MTSQVINRRNMHLAFKQVLRNKGSAGVDGMQVRELKGYIDKHITTIALSITKGYQHIVDIDLQNFFDEVDHCLLLQLLYDKVKCRVTLGLIRRWLRAPIKIKGRLTKRRKGVPQGSPLSPVLSNIMLHELDKYMEKEALKYVRYADDFSIYCKSNYAARKTGNRIFLFLKDKLKLPVNREKSGIRKPVQFEIL